MFGAFAHVNMTLLLCTHKLGFRLSYAFFADHTKRHPWLNHLQFPLHFGDHEVDRNQQNHDSEPRQDRDPHGVEQEIQGQGGLEHGGPDQVPV